MKNYILTFLLAVLVVLASVTLRRAIAANGVSTTNTGAVLAIGPGPVPIPPSQVAIGPGPVPIPPSK